MIADTVDATSCVFLDSHAWTMLDLASFTALHEPSSPMAGPIRLAVILRKQRPSAVARNALIHCGLPRQALD